MASGILRARCNQLLLTLAATCIASCTGETEPATPAVPQGVFPATGQIGPLPSLLTYANIGALEAIEAGTLVQRGPCFYLQQAPEEALVLWEKGTSIVRDIEFGVAVELPSGLRVGVGDSIRGGGGRLPTGQPISDFTNEAVPEDCANGVAVQIHSVDIVERVMVDDPDFRPLPPPPPPPPPPPSPDFLDSVKAHDDDSGSDPVVISGVDNPREALFAFLIADLRGGEEFRDRPVCLRAVDDALFANLSGRADRVYRNSACRWNDGGVVLRKDDSPAVFVDAKLDCDGKSRCVAEGAHIFGNLGGEGQGYIMRPVPGGWSVKRVGISWMS